METKKEIKFLIWTVVIFLTAFFLPVNSNTLMTAIHSTLDLAKWYAREHIVLCLLPAFFIAGVIAVFISQGAVLKYFGCKCKEMGVIYCGFSIRRHPCRVFMHHSPVVHQHI